MNRRLKMSMFAVLLTACAALGEKGVSAAMRERADWRVAFPNVSTSVYFWRFWCPWTITKGPRLRTGAIS